jgi:RHS repeat-associated protein
VQLLVSLDALGNWQETGRTSNAQNQTFITGTGMAYDANGNLTTDEQGRTIIYDAWNDMMNIGGTYGPTYNYNALGQRTAAVSPGWTDIISYFYDQWNNVVDEQYQGETVQSYSHYVWSLPAGRNVLVERDRDTDFNGALDQRLYVTQDANLNVTALVNLSGTVVERYVCDPYGAVTVLTRHWSTRTGGSGYNWAYTFQGMRLDYLSGFYHADYRDYHPALGKWVQADPIGYPDGMSRYQFVLSNPIILTDAEGLFPWDGMPPSPTVPPAGTGGPVPPFAPPTMIAGPLGPPARLGPLIPGAPGGGHGGLDRPVNPGGPGSVQRGNPPHGPAPLGPPKPPTPQQPQCPKIWSLRPLASLSMSSGGGVYAAYFELTEFDTGTTYPIKFAGGGGGAGFAYSFSVGGGETWFTTDHDIQFKDFNGFGRISSASLGVIGQYDVTFIDMPPAYLETGGWSWGASVSVGTYVGEWMVESP